MELDDLAIKAEKRYQSGYSQIYDLGNKTALLITQMEAEGTPRLESRLVINSRTDQSFEALQEITEKLSERYGKDLSLSPQEFSHTQGYENSAGNCTVNVGEPYFYYHSINSATTGIAGLLLSLLVGGVIGGVTKIVSGGSPVIADSFVAALVLGTLGGAFYGHRHNKKRLDVGNNLGILRETSERLEELAGELEASEKIRTIKSLQKEISRYKNSKSTAWGDLQRIKGGVQIKFRGTYEETEDFWNHVLTGESKMKFPVKDKIIDVIVEDADDESDAEEETEKPEKYKEVPLLGDRIIITRKHREDPNVVKIGAVLDKRYKIKEYVGSGGFNDVYMALDLKTKDLVAVKFTKEGGEQIFDSIDKLVNLEHPSLTKILDHNSSHKTPYVVTEYVDGCTLRDIIEAGKSRGKYLSPAQIEHIMVSLLDALHHAEDLNIIHRDVKPENILIGKDGRVKLTDFGLAKVIVTNNSVLYSGATEKDSDLAGTIEYLAPEVKKGKDATYASDVFAAGKVFFEMAANILDLTGRRIEDIRPDMEEFPHTQEFIYMLDDNPSERGKAYYHADEMRKHGEHDNPKLELTIRSKAKKKAVIKKKKKEEKASARPKKEKARMPKPARSTKALEVVEEEEDDREVLLA